MIAGGAPAAPSRTRLMLDLAARHGIGPQAETFPAAENQHRDRRRAQ
jgi:uncharacterized zinc-type alcohol dehydrogenase-like protein